MNGEWETNAMVPYIHSSKTSLYNLFCRILILHNYNKSLSESVHPILPLRVQIVHGIACNLT